MPVFMKSGGKGIAARGEEAAGRDAARCATRRCRSSPRCAASRSAAAARSRSTARARVAAMESYMGLVEVGVGLIPAGGGLPTSRAAPPRWRGAATPTPTSCKFLHRRLHQRRRRPRSAPARSRARKLGYLLWSDVIVPHKDELLHVASAAGRRRWPRAAGAPPARAPFPVAGRNAHRDDQGAARQHARRRLHQRARLPHRDADRRGGVRRRRRRRLAGRPRST